MLATSATGFDPIDTALAEGSSLHAREAGDYLSRLRATGRSDVENRLASRHRAAP